MTDTQKTWKSRIVGEDDVAPDQLLAHGSNFRRHSRVQQESMDAALTDIGWVQRIVVSKRTGTVLDGHMRVEMAIRNNMPTVPVTYVDVDEDEEKKVLATFDPLGGMAFIDREQLAQLASEVEFTDDALKSLHDMLLFEAGDGGQSGAGEGSQDDGDNEYMGEDDPSFWPTVSFKAPYEVRAEFYENVGKLALEPHEYIERLMRDA